MIQTGERRLPGKQIAGRLILRDSMKVSDATRRILLEEDRLENDKRHSSRLSDSHLQILNKSRDSSLRTR
jgi:hypothetical protein